MKIRKGFVSNSSSSSFVCDMCGSTESGWDTDIFDFDMKRCQGGWHIFCNSCASLLDLVTDYEDDDMGEKTIPRDKCPICQGTVLSSEQKVEALYKLFGITRGCDRNMDAEKELARKVHEQLGKD